MWVHKMTTDARSLFLYLFIKNINEIIYVFKDMMFVHLDFVYNTSLVLFFQYLILNVVSILMDIIFLGIFQPTADEKYEVPTYAGKKPAANLGLVAGMP